VGAVFPDVKMQTESSTMLVYLTGQMPQVVVELGRLLEHGPLGSWNGLEGLLESLILILLVHERCISDLADVDGLDPTRKLPVQCGVGLGI
jgi:hypothetical protein